MFNIKKGLVIFWLLLLLSAIGTLFWYNDWVYQLPTPVPDHYTKAPIGKQISLKGNMGNDTGKPVFLHFFNPDCPCSRFNIKQVNALMKEYGEKVDFRIVVMSDRPVTIEAIKRKFQLNIPISFDASLADECGVYSTPQAALLDKKHNLYYRGNYNVSRYCTDEKTNFAKIALEGLLNQKDNLMFSSLALQAYGCSLPGCDN